MKLIVFYGLCPKILYTSVWQNGICKQTQMRLPLKEQSDQGLHCHSTMFFNKWLHKKQNLGEKVWNKVFEILGHLLYIVFAVVSRKSKEEETETVFCG